jgi:toxin secretion/phage lysis holin
VTITQGCFIKKHINIEYEITSVSRVLEMKIKIVRRHMRMKETWTYLQVIIAALGGWFGWLLGGFDGFLYALIAFVVLDYITGIMRAILERQLSSEIGAKGIFKKVLIFFLVGVAHIIDSQIFEAGNTVRTAVIFFYLSNEGISIIENAAKIGLPIPKKLKDVLVQLKGKEEDEGK